MRALLIFLSLALLAPSVVLAATELTLGGYIKLQTFWDSTQTNKDMSTAIARNNDQLFHHGHLQMTAQHSRLKLEFKGPNLWGAKTLGFIEFDFEGSGSDPLLTPSHSFAPRLRHAMFQLNWPDTELRFGQYYALLDEYRPEGLLDTELLFHGATSYRIPQIRLTQKFLGAWTVAGLIGKPTNPATANDATFFNQVVNAPPLAGNTTLGLEGQSAETPNLQGMIRYEADLWGKGPFEGRPRGFTAQVTAGWQRLRYRSNTAAATFFTFGQNQFATAANSFQAAQQNLDPWMVMADLFIPLLPTRSHNLAGSASLLTQWYIGQGLFPFGFGRSQDQSWFEFKGQDAAGQFMYDRRLTSQFGGFVQGQYWFNNQWYVNVVWGMQRHFGIDRSTSAFLAGRNGANNVIGYKYATLNDQVKLWQQIDLTLYYWPHKALKFGLQYCFGRTDWLQKVANPNPGPNAGPTQPDQNQGSPNAGAKDVGEAHRVMWAAWFYF